MLRRAAAPLLLGRSERGLYFPINHRIVDERIDASVAEQADVQSRYRRALRTGFTTGATRQTAVPPRSLRRGGRPTHFLSLPLPARNVLLPRVAAMHKAVQFSHAYAAPLLVPPARLHVTLGVMALGGGEAEATPEQVAAISECVAAAARECLPADGLRLHFRGLGTFSDGRVVFIRCQCEEGFNHLDALVRRVRRELAGGALQRRAGPVDLLGNPHDSYVPHITVAKVRPAQRAQYGRAVPHSVWADFQHEDFGAVTFERIDLCSMRGEGDNGYYRVLSSADLAGAAAGAAAATTGGSRVLAAKL